jgi:hypothetical protein
VFGGAEAVQPATFFTAALFKQTHGFNTKNKTCWDAELLVDMADMGARFCHLREALAVFRLHKSSITGSGRLSSEYSADADRLFARIGGRPRRRTDVALEMYYRIRKRLLQVYGK